MFNVYLEHALKSSKELKAATENGKLLAFADDLVIIADSTEEFLQFLKELEGLEAEFGLQINKSKTVWLSNRLDMRGVTSIGWVQRVESFRYLGVNCSLSLAGMRKDAEKTMFKNLKAFSYKLKSIKDFRIQNAVQQAYIRSCIIYHCTALKLCGVIDYEFIQRMETKAFRRILRISNYINNDIIKKWDQGIRVEDAVRRGVAKV